jgi:hypothetical protein
MPPSSQKIGIPSTPSPSDQGLGRENFFSLAGESGRPVIGNKISGYYGVRADEKAIGVLGAKADSPGRMVDGSGPANPVLKHC